MSLQKSKINQFKKVWAEANADAKSANNKALESGRILSELKDENYNGWVKFCENELKGIISRQQADKLIECYQGRYILKAIASDEPLTIGNMLSAINSADETLKSKAAEIQKAEIDKRLQAEREAEEAAKIRREAAEAEAARKAAQPKYEDDAIEGEFTEVKAAPQKPVKPEVEEVKPRFIHIEAEEWEELNDRFAETVSVNDSQSKEIESLCKILDSGDQMEAAVKEIKRLTDIYVALENRLNGHLNGCQHEKKELIITLNIYKRRAEKAEKKLLELGHGKKA